MFSQKDLQQIRSKGISIDDINQQIKHFQQGFPPADITLPATPGKGIMLLNEGDQQHYKDVYRTMPRIFGSYVWFPLLERPPGCLNRYLMPRII